MKIKYLITGVLASVLAFSSCVKPDELPQREATNLSSLGIKGRLVSDESVNYDAVVDDAAKTITVQVPYYISETERIQGDLTQMKLQATMPVGARFEPGLGGIHDLAAGFRTTLLRENGSHEDYTINAVYVKSDKAFISKVSLAEAPSALIAIKAPEAESNGQVTIYKTSSSLDAALKSAELVVSPWATIETTALNPDGTIDLSDKPEIYIVAQDGTKQKYVTSIDSPTFVPVGKMGHMSLLFGFQVKPDDTHGFRAGENRTLAVVGDYLVVGSTALNFVVMNRYSGKTLDNVKVNTTGLLSGVIHAISSDDAGHLVAVAFAANNNQYVSNRTFEIYAWKNGITNAPEKVLSADIATSDTFAQFRSTNPSGVPGTWDIGRMISVKGDVTGEAMLMTLASNTMNRLLRVKFEGGRVASVLGSARGLDSWAAQSKPIPMSTADECAYVFCSANGNKWIYHVPEKEGATVKFLPKGNWWATSLISIDYVEFNGMKLVGLQNQLKDAATMYCRLCVGNIGSMAPDAFTTSQIIDSRLDNYDPAKGPTGPGLGNATITGMTSSFGALGTNGNGTGDVVFGQSEDGNAVQVYMLTTDHGIIAYELTRYDI